jgi:alpha-L-fucosidase
MASGEIPSQALMAWKEMAKWMKHSRESVIGAKAGPWPEEVNTPITTNPGVAYLHFLPGDTSSVIWKNAPKPTRAILLRNNHPVDFKHSNGTLEINLPRDLRSTNVDVVKLIIEE